MSRHGLDLADLAAVERGKRLRGDAARSYWARQRELRREAGGRVMNRPYT